MSLPEPTSPLNSLADVAGERSPPSSLLVSDVTLREGEQAQGVSFALETKLELALELEAAGVGQVQVGYPGRFARDAAAVNAVAGALAQARTEAVALAFVEDWEDEIAACAASEAEVINVVFRSSKRLQSLLGLSEDEALARVGAAVELLRGSGKIVAFTPSDSTRAEPDHLAALWDAAASAGAARVYVADSMGAATPELIAWLVGRARSVTGLPVGVHCHDDLGLVVANTVAGVMAGAEIADVAVNGLGDRAGNAPLEEVAAALALGYGVDAGVKLVQLTALSRRFAEASGRPVPANKAVSGAQTFAHVLPTHVEAMKRDPRAIQSYEAEIVGNTPQVGTTGHVGTTSDPGDEPTERVDEAG